ncbi:hypothetical protein JXA88_05120 [Candidatus Fermentibacteria bacterium]|nr:hypothetical protein [Candidatus Fermentibacteria bacterium]
MRGGGKPGGGTLGYLPERIYREVAYIAYHFHWPRPDIMSMTHKERQRWVKEIACINNRMNNPGREGDAGEPV